MIQAYTRTSYWVEVGNHRICLRVGEPSSDLDEVLAHFSVEDWAYVTAYNPRSVELSRGENEASQNKLIQDVQSKGYPTLPGEGCGDDGEWPPEPSVFTRNATRGSRPSWNCLRANSYHSWPPKRGTTLIIVR